MDPILTVTAGNITAMLAYASGLFTDLSVIVVLAIGLPLGFWVIRKVISLVRAR